MVKRTQYVLKCKSVDGRNIVIEIVIAKAIFTKPGINFIGCGIRVRNAGYPPRGISHRLDAVQKFRYNGACLPASRTGDEAYMARFRNRFALFIR
jgi:hypothetical protein